MESNDAKKLRNKLLASVGIATKAIRESYIAVCHPDLRQDIEALPGFVVASKYSDQGDAMEGEIGAVGSEFITTTKQLFLNAGDTNGVANCVSTKDQTVMFISNHNGRRLRWVRHSWWNGQPPI